MQGNINYLVPFYTAERWNNWIAKAKESGFKLEDQDKGAVFVNMEDDVVLACLKLIARFEKGTLSAEDALSAISEIKDIVLKKLDPISEDIDMMMESIQLSLMGVFAAAECYVMHAFEKDLSLEDTIKAAIEAEKNDDFGSALGYIAEIGACVISGKEIPAKLLEDVPESIVAEWLDGIDSISAAMVGDTSYKEDEADEGAD